MATGDRDAFARTLAPRLGAGQHAAGDEHVRGALGDKRTVDLNDSRSIGELATKLYQPLRGLLRGELIVDRERAGLLSDFR